MLGKIHDGNAVQMVILMLDAAGQHIIGLHLKPFAMAILRLDLDMLRTLDCAVVPREGQAALIQINLLVAQLEDFGVDELNKLVLVVLGDFLRQVTVIEADEQTAHHTYLRAGQTKTVGIEQGFLHIVEQGAQTIIKLGNGAADFFQNRVAVLNDCTQCHKNNLQILGDDAYRSPSELKSRITDAFCGSFSAS